MRLTSFSSGTGTGQAAQRWIQENWKPVNALGYRDMEIDETNNNNKLIFLGDSFTAGYGVKFDETYYYKVRKRFGEKYQFVNLGQPGASTQKEVANFDLFTTKYGKNIDTVVHQYLGNDIDDYLPKDYMAKISSDNRSELRKWIIKHSEIASLVDSYFFYRSFGQQYMNAIFSEFRDDKLLTSHLADLNNLYEKIHDANAKVILLLFPFLNNDEILTQSTDYAAKVKKYFYSKCRRGDALIDVFQIAAKLTASERIVSQLDAHPSVILHAKIGEALNIFVSNKTGNEDFVTMCARS